MKYLQRSTREAEAELGSMTPVAIHTPVSHQGGVVIEYSIQHPPGEWCFWIIAVDEAGNRSLPSRMLRRPLAPSAARRTGLAWCVRVGSTVHLTWTWADSSDPTRTPDPRLAFLIERSSIAGGYWSSSRDGSRVQSMSDDTLRLTLTPAGSIGCASETISTRWPPSCRSLSWRRFRCPLRRPSRTSKISTSQAGTNAGVPHLRDTEVIPHVDGEVFFRAIADALDQCTSGAGDQIYITSYFLNPLMPLVGMPGRKKLGVLLLEKAGLGADVRVIVWTGRFFLGAEGTASDLKFWAGYGLENFPLTTGFRDTVKTNAEADPIASLRARPSRSRGRSRRPCFDGLGQQRVFGHSSR